MPIEILCKTCGQAYTPTVEDLRCGPQTYRECPNCRPRVAQKPEKT